MRSFQELSDPHGICFGCGTANPEGLHIRSHPDADGVHVIATMQPDAKYSGWSGLVYGGYLAMLSDCHSNWTAIYAHYQAEGRPLDSEPRIVCVTGSLSLAYHKPTPLGVPLRLRARVDGAVGHKTDVVCEISANGIVTVTSRAVLVRVDIDKLAERAHALP
ncbi:MAG: PaaI family thioesterase [Deltaproteobacteria bacterium]|nr:PaaI family thioesterase [Deltaproteobacteria bacterium]